MALIANVLKNLLGVRRDPADEPEVGAALPRSFEEQIYASVVAEGDICYDIGANFGEVAVFLARLAGPEGLVVAFEPVMPVYCQLCAWVQLAVGPRAPVITLPMGMADAERVATIQVPRGSFGLGSLAQPEAWSRTHQDAEIASYTCRFATLDGFIQTSGVAKPDFIKIDVEGAELLVLRGGNAMFEAGHRPLILMELFAPWERSFGYGPWDVLSPLVEYGYGFLFACPEGLVEHQPSAGKPFPPEYARGYNVLAWCREAHGDRAAALAGLRTGGGSVRLPMLPPPVPNALA